MTLYKFLRRGAVGPYSGFHWPTPTDGAPGDWVVVEGELRLASNAIHACRADQLPFWLDTELWEIEIDGPVEEAERHVIARRGRLVRRIDPWDGEASREFAHACAERSRHHASDALRSGGQGAAAAGLEAGDGPGGLMTAAYGSAADVPEELTGVVLDAGDTGFAVHSGMTAALAGFLAARTARHAATASGRSGAAADVKERRWQADWLIGRLGLAPA